MTHLAARQLFDAAQAAGRPPELSLGRSEVAAAAAKFLAGFALIRAAEPAAWYDPEQREGDLLQYGRMLLGTFAQAVGEHEAVPAEEALVEAVQFAEGEVTVPPELAEAARAGRIKIFDFLRLVRLGAELVAHMAEHGGFSRTPEAVRLAAGQIQDLALQRDLFPEMGLDLGPQGGMEEQEERLNSQAGLEQAA